MKKISFLFLFQLLLSYAYSSEKEGITIFKTENKVIYDICFSAKGEVIGIADNNNINVYRTSSKELLREFKNGHHGQILTIDISKDSTLMVSGGKDSTIVIWDFVNGNKLKSLHIHKGIITSVAISPDGRYLASGGTDHKVSLYDIKNGTVAAEFREHTDDITRVVFSHDGKLLAAAGGDKIITVYSTDDHSLVGTLFGHTSWVRDIAFSHDSQRLISCGDDSRVIKWNMSDPRSARNISANKYGHHWILSLDSNEDDNTYVLADLTGSIKILWLQGTYIGNIKVPVTRVLFKPHYGKMVTFAVATRGKGVMLIDATALKFYMKQKYYYFPFKS